MQNVEEFANAPSYQDAQRLHPDWLTSGERWALEHQEPQHPSVLADAVEVTLVQQAGNN